jgi:hypothetical protein
VKLRHRAANALAPCRIWRFTLCLSNLPHQASERAGNPSLGSGGDNPDLIAVRIEGDDFDPRVRSKQVSVRLSGALGGDDPGNGHPQRLTFGQGSAPWQPTSSRNKVMIVRVTLFSNTLIMV